LQTSQKEKTGCEDPLERSRNSLYFEASLNPFYAEKVLSIDLLRHLDHSPKFLSNLLLRQAWLQDQRATKKTGQHSKGKSIDQQELLLKEK
jgi:hypothetical protein